jgi:hypothetical protein
MSDPLRTDITGSRDAGSGSDRIAKIEQLLLLGLDRYFAGDYQQAINVWTRALFLDRMHPRARAYIERARSALAERQRESEELLQKGVAAFHRGEGEQARRLLRDALDRGAPHDEALAVLQRLDRLAPGDLDDPQRAGTMARPARTRGADRFGRAARLAGWGLAAAALTGAAVWAGRTVAEWQAEPLQGAAGILSASGAAGRSALPPVPTRGERALARGQALAAGGRLHDALTALEQVPPTDVQKPQADRLRAHIQRQLLALALGRPVDPLPPDTLRP